MSSAPAQPGARILDRPRESPLGAAHVKTHSPEERPVVFLDVSQDDIPLGRIEVTLFRDQVPFTCDNFIALCTGEILGNGRFHKRKMHYKGSSFHRVLPGFICQGGDYILGNGKGGESIYGRRFRDEAFDCLFTKRGQVAMANSGGNDNRAQFFITFAEVPSVNCRAVLFGEIIDTESMKTLARIENAKIQVSNKKTCVIISDCGILKNHPGFLMTRFYESDPRSLCHVGHPPVRIIPG